MLVVFQLFSCARSNDELGNLLSLFSGPKPEFIALPKSTDEFNLKEKYEIATTITSNLVEELRPYEYFKSTIIVQEKCVFRGNYAFGSKIAASGSGGAIFVSYSNLFIEDAPSFIENTANIGGAICCLSSSAFINIKNVFSKREELNDGHHAETVLLDEKEITFSSNLAYKFGGAIYFQGTFDKKKAVNTPSEKAILVIESYNSPDNFIETFINNEAYELGGAICISMAESAHITKCTFCKNMAATSGGAICSTNAELSIAGCAFFSNQCNFDEVKKGLLREASGASEEIRLKRGNPIHTPRGGGAIFFSSDPFKLGYGSKDVEMTTRLLSSSGCCFYGNRASHSTDFNGSPGHEIMLNGYATWQSVDDFTAFVDGLSIGKAAQNKFTPIVNMFNAQEINDESCGPISPDYSKPATETAETIVASTPSRSTNGNDAESIPTPSEYVYQDTPKPETPYATTSSWSKYSHRTAPTIPTIPDIKRTLVETPFSSPFQSPKVTFQGVYVSPVVGPDDKTSTTNTFTWIVTNVTLTENEDEGPHWISTSTYLTTIYTSTDVVFIDNSAIGGDITGNNNSKLGIIIGCAVAGIVLIIVIVIIVWFLVTRKNSESSSTSNIEMLEETVINASSQKLTTDENLLWTTSVMADADDPFANDFEEGIIEGFFK